jgi:hypothetical protein
VAAFRVMQQTDTKALKKFRGVGLTTPERLSEIHTVGFTLLKMMTVLSRSPKHERGCCCWSSTSRATFNNCNEQ